MISHHYKPHKQTKTLILGILLLLLLASAYSQQHWYVHPSGHDSLYTENGRTMENPLQSIEYAFNNAASAGDTIYVMGGTYHNEGYGNGTLDNPVVAYLSNSGTADQWLVLKNYPGDTVRICFDGAGGFAANSLQYVEISGFLIEGPNQHIVKDSALAHRLSIPKPNYYNGRGIAIWGEAHHVRITHNTISNCPASGIRINKGDYLTVSHNEVFNNTWYTSSAESAVVFAESQSIDMRDTIKMVMSNNLVHNNFNQIPFYTPNPPDVGIENYGTAAQDYIIDGSGVYITRNTNYNHGWYYLANNVTYHNGINGLVVHRTDRAIVVNNTAFMNGKVPLSQGRQNSSGIAINEADQVRVYNNILWARYETDYALKKYGTVNIAEMEANLIAHGLSDYTQGVFWADPLFTDTASFDLSLAAGSFAIDAGIKNSFIPEDDYLRRSRDNFPDIGALEYLLYSSGEASDKNKSPAAFLVYPNPFQNYLVLTFDSKETRHITLTSYQGIRVADKTVCKQEIFLPTSNIRPGIYLLTATSKDGNTIHRTLVKYSE